MSTQVSPTNATDSALESSRFDQYVSKQLQQTSNQVKLIELMGSLMTLAAIWLGTLLAVCVIDAWIFPLGNLMRLVILALMVGVGIYFLAFRIVPLLIRKINPAYAAKVVESSKPTLKNSLLNYLFLRSERRYQTKIFNAVQQQAANDLSSVSTEATVDRSHLIKVGFVLVGIVLAAGLYKVFSPKDPVQTLARVMAPLADIQKPSQVRITRVEPGDATVFFGQTLPVSAEVRGVGKDQDVILLYSTDDGQFVDAVIPMARGNDRYQYVCDLVTSTGGIQHSLSYRIVAGDGRSSDYRVTTRPNPTITVESVEYRPPAYTELPPRTVEGNGDIQGLEGTRVKINARANMEIDFGYIELLSPISRERGETGSSPSGSSKFRGKQIAMQVDGVTATGEFGLRLKPGTTTAEYTHYRVSFSGPDGATNDEQVIYPIQVKPDIAPEVEVLEPTEQKTLLPVNRTLKIKVRAADPDFKISAIRIEGDFKGTRLIRQNLPLGKQAGVGNVRTEFNFRPSAFQLKPGDEVVFYAMAADNRTSYLSPAPDPNRSRTDNYTIVVAEPEQGVGPGQRDDPNPQNNQDSNSDQEPSSQGGNSSDQGSSGGDDASAQPESDSDSESSKGNQGGGGDSSSSGNAEKSEDDTEGGNASQNSSSDSSNSSQSPSKSNGNSNNNPSGSNADSDQSPGEGDNSTGNSNENPGGKGESGTPSESEGNQENPPNESGISGDQGTSNATGSQQNQRMSDNAPLDESSTQGERLERMLEYLKNQEERKEEAKRNQGGNRDQADTENQGSRANENRQNADGNQDSNRQNGTSSSENPNDGSKGRGQERETGNRNSSNDRSNDRENGNRGAEETSDPTQPEQDAGNSENGREGGSDSNTGDDKRGNGDSDNRESGKGESSDRESQDGKPKQDPSESQTAGDQKSNGDADSGDKNQSDSTGTDSKGEQGDKPSPQSDSGDADQNASDADSGAKKGEQGSDRKGQSNNQGESSSAQKQNANSNESSKGNSGEPRQSDRDSESQGNADRKEGSEGNQTAADSSEGGKAGDEKGPESSAGQDARTGGPTSDRSDNLSKLSPDVIPPDERERLEYARKATDLALSYLKDQKNDPDPELLEQLNWTDEELRQFMDRWEKMRQKATTGSAADKKRYEDALRSLGLRPQTGRNQKAKSQRDNISGLNEDGAVTKPPAKHAEGFRNFLKGRSRADNR